MSGFNCFVYSLHLTNIYKALPVYQPQHWNIHPGTTDNNKKACGKKKKTVDVGPNCVRNSAMNKRQFTSFF